MPELFRDDITDDQRAEAIGMFAEKFAEKRDLAFEHIHKFVRKFNPLHILAVMAAKGLTTSPGDGGRTTLKDAMERITQDHIEFLQAMCLTVELDGVSREMARPPEVQMLWDQLIELGRGYDLARLRPLDLSNPEDAVVRVRERIHSHTRGVRNWGYYHQVKRIGRGLFEPLDSRLLQRLGFSGSSLIAVLDSLIRTNESRINDHRRKYLPAIMKKSLTEMVKAYAEAMPQADCSDLLNYFSRNGVSIDQARMILLSHSDTELSDCFIHDAAVVSEKSGVDIQEVKEIFHALGLAPGALIGRDAQKFLLDNPVWTSPLVLLGDDVVFACIPQVAFSFLFETIAGLLRPYADLATAWQDRRAAFLEEETARLLHKALPGSVIHRNLEWRTIDNRVNGETDLLVVVDSLLLIVEAKSGAISASSKRGAPDRLRSEIKELLEAPALQSQRAAAVFADHISGRARLNLPNSVDLSLVKCVMRLSVTLEDFWTLQSDLGELQRVGLLSPEVAPAPAIGLTGLDTLCEVLDHPSVLLHYFHRRAQLEGRFSHDSDELDLLGCYAMNGLLFGNMETNGSRIIFHGMADAVDRYMTALSEGITLPKPTRQLSTWWRQILERVELHKRPRWVEAAIAVLDIDDDGQKIIERNLKRLMKKHGRQATKPYLDSIVFIPGGIAYAAVAVLVLNDKNYADRQNKSNAVAERVFSDPRPQRCIVIGFNSDRPLQPYNFIWMVDRSEFMAADLESSSVAISPCAHLHAARME